MTPPSRTLDETVKLLNSDVDPAIVTDTLIVQMYGYSSMTLRARYELSPHADLRRAMAIRNRFLYNYFCMAEEGLRLYLEAMIVKQGYMPLEEITRQAALVANSYGKHARGIGKFLNELVDELGFEVDTGSFFEAEVSGEDDSDDDENPF